ncbi:Psilocybin cluster transcription regulator [Frankliniella fusca]|uniref:Psilocybin cluster transcription regulator n=1 Tax=Frankliniella fusca TaxID=407009 RepID=A0AAE1I3N9_9NEOP|nr:Psilocybin cluster transcription regulator [Frankliniella fusca]
MGKKEASKGREWEKGRRDVLNQTFNELHRALPSYAVGQTLSKKTILIQALSCIRELQQSKAGDAKDEHAFKLKNVEKWVQNILIKFNQLLAFLETINAKVPADCLAIDAPPPEISIDIRQLLPKLDKSRLLSDTSSQENHTCREQNSEENKKSGVSNDLNLANSSSYCTRSNQSKTVCSSNASSKVSLSENLLGNSSESFAANPSVIQSRPFVMQSSLQMPPQLLFTSNSSNSPLTSTLPLLVSVTGVKTVNPFILVQSNIMAPNPSAPQKVIRSQNSRPIQPCPTSKISRKTQKIPIPSLRQKMLLNGFSHCTPLRGIKKNLGKDAKPSHDMKSGKSIRKKKILKGKQSLSKVDAPKLLVGHKLKKSSAIDLNMSKNIADQDNKTAAGTVSDVDKENIVCCDLSTEPNAVGSAGNTHVSGDTVVPTENESTKVDDREEHSEPQCIMKSPLKNQEAIGTSVGTGTESSNMVKKRTLESDDINCNKPQKCKNNVNQEKTTLEHGDSHASRMSKSNYSISALCAQQQLLQTTENDHLYESASIEMKSSDTEKIKHQSNPNMESNNMSVVTVNCSIEKDKVTLLSSSDGCNEWSEKCKMKPDRPSASFNIFSSLPLHNSKNTFIPINEIENFKVAPEPFDSNDNTFSLPLQPTDLPNDLFASLQVPSGGQHPESISPTAAFLLAFPLVSTSKATELDEAVCENTDSQPGIKTILQIGNLDCDTPITKCVSVFSSIENSSVVYTSPNVFSQDTLTASALKNRISTSDVLNFPSREAPLKTTNDNTASVKENQSFFLKSPESSLSLKGSLSFSSKDNYQPICTSSNKRICTSRTESTTVSSISYFNGQSNGMRAPVKNGTLQQGGGVNKSPQKLIHSIESSTTSTFFGCEKPTDWLEMPQAPLAIFPDYPVTNTSRSDCAVNYVLPPVLMSSSAGGEELLAVSKSQGSSSIPNNILSWSTISSTGNNQPPSSTSKLTNFQEVCPSMKSSSKTGELQQLVPNQNILRSASQTEMAETSMSTIGNKLNSVPPTYAENSSENSSLLVGKPTSHSQNFLSQRTNTGAKKSFPALAGEKELVCSSSEVLKISAVSCGPVTHQEETRAVASHSISAKMMYPSSENKLSRASNVYFDDKAASQNLKMGMSNGPNTSSKDPSSLLNYNQNNIVPVVTEEKQLHSDYSQITNLTGKGPITHQSTENNYNHQTNILPKQNIGSGSQYSSGTSGGTDSKKNVSPFTQNSGGSIEVQKHTTSSLHFSAENTSMLQFGSNAIDLPSGQNDSFTIKSNVLEDKSQSSQQRQVCVRSNNKESVTNLHRPPVNWMTAPDIRSHQHHSGPSFGNSSNMSSTQGLLYLPEHIKESENSGPVFDQATNFHCLDIAHSAQPLYKGNEHHLFGNDNIENFHDNSAWSPSKNGGSSMLGNMIIPSTLPTLVGDLALGDNHISRPFLPSFNNDSQGCLKKSAKRMINTSRRIDRSIEETSVASATVGGQECAGSFLSVSQLVDNSNAVKSRTTSLSKENHLSFTGSFTDNDTPSCLTSKHSSLKSVSSNYSTEALLSSTIHMQTNHPSNRKRRSHGANYSNNYAGSSMPYQNSSSVSLQTQGPQNQYLPDLPRTNDYQGTFIPSDTAPPFILGNSSSRSHRNHSYSLQNVTDRPSVENSSNPLKPQHGGVMLDNTAVRPRTHNHSATSNATSSAAVSSSSNIIDFGYMNMTTAVLQDDINFTNHPPPPSFLPHHTYSMPASQDPLYSTPRLSMHPTHHHPQNSNIQSPSATTLTNFHLSTIFPEINDKVIC